MSRNKMSFYERVVRYTWRKDRRLLFAIVTLTAKLLPWLFVVVFGICALILLFTLNLKIIFFIAVPLVSFIIATILRNYLNFKRPFEVYCFKPSLPHKEGKSFPSRHSTMAASIAMACLYLNTPLGIIMLILASFVSISRIMCGLHFIKDCVAGWIIGGVLSMLGFFFIAQLCGV